MHIESHEETETIDRLFLELSQFTKAKTKRDLQLDELLFAVERKFPGETRFQTALRYIREAEARQDCGPVDPPVSRLFPAHGDCDERNA